MYLIEIYENNQFLGYFKGGYKYRKLENETEIEYPGFNADMDFENICTYSSESEINTMKWAIIKLEENYPNLEFKAKEIE